MPDIRHSLDDDADTRRMVAEFDDRVGAAEPVLPTVQELPIALMRLAVPHEDIDALCTLLPRMSEPGESWLLRLCLGAVIDGIGSVEGMLALPRLRVTDDLLSRYFYVFVYLAAADVVEGYHRAHGVPAEVTAATFTDLGRNMAVSRLRHPGVGAFDEYHWLSIHYAGALYALGRLQFQRARLGVRTSEAIVAAGFDARRGEPVLSLHIPRFYGPMTMPLVESAVDLAREFFPAHFPDERYRYAVCKSWLLDPQFADYLPARSNILAFQRRLRHAYSDGKADDAGVLQFVFEDSTRPREQLPRDTSLQRGLLDHLDSGGHWYPAMAWLEL